MERFRLLTIATLAFALAAAGCTGGSSDPASTSGPTASNNNASLNKDDYPVFPDADAGADPSVPAEAGGKGFNGEGWETNTSYDLMGDPRAVKGGLVRRAQTDFPSTLRYLGPNVTAWNATLHSLVYETLLGMHSTTLEYIPGIATHWQISEDKKTYRFRINPNARFSDNTPVTSEDVIASWKLNIDKPLQDPARLVIFSKFQEPVAESKYIVRVSTNAASWQDFMTFSNALYIYPAQALKGLTGGAYIKEYNYKMLPGSGAYIVNEQDVDKGKTITVRRRKDYWAEKERRNVGLYNFDEVLEVVVRDRALEFEMFKKGDLDYYVVNRASMWVQELDYDNMKRGLNQKRKVFNHNPQGKQGLAMNTRREPYNDIRVRKALRHLFPREQMIEKLMFNEYYPMDSYFEGSPYENMNNEKIDFNPQKAIQLLAEAGWKDRDSSGRLVKNGRPLSLEVLYYDKVSQERTLTPYQEQLRMVGITLNLRLVTWETLIKLIDERTFDMVTIAYTGETFPLPEMSYLSKLADEKNTNNITGFKNARADEIIAQYNAEFDLQKRIKLLQEFDGIITNEHHMILEWTAPYERFAFWSKFGMPEGVITNVGDSRDVPAVWWIDPDKQQKLEAALKDPSIQLEVGETDNRYWLEYVKKQEQAGLR
jgi:microcin C transport system substrate-binding protein